MTKDRLAYSAQFAGKHILVVEDEYFLADETRRKLQKLGAVVGPASRVDQALDIIDKQRVDAAILDIHLDEDLVFPVTERLEALGIPYVFATGYDPSIIPARFSGFVLSAKPIDLEHIAKAFFAPDKDSRPD